LLILKRIHKKGREEYFKGNIKIAFPKPKQLKNIVNVNLRVGLAHLGVWAEVPTCTQWTQMRSLSPGRYHKKTTY